MYSEKITKTKELAISCKHCVFNTYPIYNAHLLFYNYKMFLLFTVVLCKY